MQIKRYMGHPRGASNYMLHDIVFRTAKDGMLARACDGAVVAFEVDEMAPDGQSGWSVLVVGMARLLEGSRAVRATELTLVSAPGADEGAFVSISFGRLTGRVIDGADASSRLAHRPTTTSARR